MPETSNPKRCLWCSAPALPDRSLCADHLHLAKARASERKAKGICRACPNPVEEGHALCSTCRAKRREAYATRGTCNDCGAKVEGASRCPKCAEAHRRRKRERYACK